MSGSSSRSGALACILLLVMLVAPSAGALVVSDSPADDLDGDGVSDLLVPVGSGGAMAAVSGASGRELWRVSHSAAEVLVVLEPLGGDLDGDGAQDVVFGRRAIDGEGSVHLEAVVLSGRDGTELASHRVSPNSDEGSWSLRVAGQPDVTGDGVPELLVQHQGGPAGAFRAELIDLVEDRIVWAVRPTQPGVYHLQPAGDVIGSSTSDLYLIGLHQPVDSPLCPLGLCVVGAGETMSVTLLDGDARETVWTHALPGNRFGSVFTVPDVDGDGAADVLQFALTDSGSSVSYAGALISGVTGRSIWRSDASGFPVTFTDLDGVPGADFITNTWLGGQPVAERRNGRTNATTAARPGSTYLGVIDDVDGDTRPDLLRDDAVDGVVVAESVDDGNELWRADGGWGVALTGDLTGDGRADLLRSTPTDPDAVESPRRTAAIDVMTGTVVWEVLVPFSWSAVTDRDVTGDGAQDLLLVRADPEGRSVATARALDGRTGESLWSWTEAESP